MAAFKRTKRLAHGGIPIKARSLISNPISFAGAMISCISLLIIVFILVADWIGFEWNPYVGVVTLLILPAITTFGIVLIPLGKAWERRRKGRPTGMISVNIDLDNASVRRRILVYTAIASVVLSFMSATAYEAIVFMDTTAFCGEVCHSVMEPELTSYRHGSHARVPCVECHIGEGADWFVQSKLSGVRQVFAVALNTYSTPIPAPVENLRPARETCEHCHWPEKFHGTQLVVNTRFEEDEANTPLYNVLMMKIGGGDLLTGEAEGIHWHTNSNFDIEYVALDDKRLKIPYVRMTGPDGGVTEFFAEDTDVPHDELRAMPRRLMDGMGAHNRPAHTFEVPTDAVDEAMVAGQIAKVLPYIKREAVSLLTAEYDSREEVEGAMRLQLRRFYEENYPEVAQSSEAEIDASAFALASIYRRNIFPHMNITWNTYENHIGHTFYTGCYRCHDDEHTTPDGDHSISQDCESCHALLAFEEEDPQPVLEDLPLR